MKDWHKEYTVCIAHNVKAAHQSLSPATAWKAIQVDLRVLSSTLTAH